MHATTLEVRSKYNFQRQQREMRRRIEEAPLRVFVGGGQDFHGPTSQRDAQIVRKVPEILYRFAPEVQIVTGGMPGIADIFSNEWAKLGGNCLDVVSQEYHQDYVERNTGRPVMICGNDQKHRRLKVSSLEGIKCALFIQGGKYSTHEIKLFQEKGVPVVTLYGGGGASGGQCPYEGWTYEAPKHVLNSIVASKDPEESVFNMANVLVGSVIHEISQPLRDIRSSSAEESKKQKMAENLTKSTMGIDGDEVRPMEIEEEEEHAGLLCVPPGMSAEEVQSFNKMFLSKDKREQSAMIEQMAQIAQASGSTVINLKIGEDGKIDEESTKAVVAQIAAQLKSQQGEKTKEPKCPNCLVDPGVVDGKCKYGCGWYVDQEEKVGPIPVAFSIDIESRGDDLLKHGILSIGYCVGRLDREEVIERGRISFQPLQYLSYYQTRMIEHNLPAYADMYAFWSGMKHEIEEEGKTNHPDPPSQDIVAKVKTQQFEERCLQEFWLNEEKFPGNKKRMQIMMGEAIDAIEGIKKFRALLDRYDDGVNFKAKVISDNIIFDGGWIDYYLSLAQLPRLQHDSKGRYRRVFDTVDYRRGACHMDYGDKWMNEKAIIEHFGITVDPDDHTHMPDDDAEYIYRFHVQIVNKISRVLPPAFRFSEITMMPKDGFFPNVTITSSRVVEGAQPTAIDLPPGFDHGDRTVLGTTNQF